MRRYVERSDRLISCAVRCDKPNNHAGFVKKQCGAIRAHLKSACTFFTVHFHDFLTRLLLIRTLRVQVRIYHRIIQRISRNIVHFHRSFLHKVTECATSKDKVRKFK